MWKPLAVLTVLALLTRFYRLGVPDMWMDEIVIFREAFSGEFKTVSYAAHSAHLKPVGIMMHLLGQTPFGLRFWGALLGALAVPVIAASSGLFIERRAAMVAGALALLNPYLLFYAQDGNYYGGMTFYTSLQLLGAAMALLGAWYSGLLITLIAGFVSYKNHPIGILPGGFIPGLLALFVLIVPKFRKSLISFSPLDWERKPALPLALMGVGIVIFFFWSKIIGTFKTASGMLSLGETTLTNVAFTWTFFRADLTGFFDTNFRSERNYFVLPFATMLVLILAVVLLIADKNESRPRPGRVFLGTLCVALPIVAYTILFSIQANRNFNLRYFTFLVPVFLAGMGGIVLRWKQLHFLTILVCLLWTYRVGQYYRSDLNNFENALPLLKSEYANTPKISVTRNDSVGTQFYLNQGGLASTPPVYTYFNQPVYADLFGSSFPFFMNGASDTLIMSSWREVQEPILQAFLREGLRRVYTGTSKLGEDQDLLISHIGPDNRIIYPNLEATITIPAKTTVRVAFAGAGRWEAAPGWNLAEATPGVMSVMKENNADKPLTVSFTPKGIPDKLVLDRRFVASFPEHTKIFATESPSGLRNERDGTYDFFVFQPEGPRRQLAINLQSRDANDPLLVRNGRAVPPDLWISVAVDGSHQGIWHLLGGPPRDERIVLPFELPEGNHRVSVTGFSPRLDYTPYFPWVFYSIEWNASRETPTPSVAGISLTGQWKEIPKVATTDGKLSPQWVVQGPVAAAPDASVTGPAGDISLKFDFPSGAQTPLRVFAPPFAVESGSLLGWSFYLKLSAMEETDLTPVVAYFDAQQRQMGGLTFCNGPNSRGTTYGKGWIRRELWQPVPPGATYAAVGFVTNPVAPQRTVAGQLWIASFSTPLMKEVTFSDPALPDSYFRRTTP